MTALTQFILSSLIQNLETNKKKNERKTQEGQARFITAWFIDTYTGIENDDTYLNFTKQLRYQNFKCVVISV